VANCGSNSITVVSLSALQAAATVPLGGRPTTVTLDPNGASIWVGGQGFMASIDRSSLAVSTQPLNGTATTCGTSSGQNRLICTVLTNAAEPAATDRAPIDLYSSNVAVRVMDGLYGMAAVAEVAGASGENYAGSYARNVGLAFPTQVAGATQVSASAGNGI